MYFCGPTVYQRAHIGNARPFVLGMWLRAWLMHRDYEVKFVHNITDVDDKIYDAAPGPSAEVAARAAEWYLEDIDRSRSRAGRTDCRGRPRASARSAALIEKLVESGHAYAVQGDVYFRVSRDPDYGRLSGQRPDQVAEQEPNPLKEDPRDFALWKATKPGEDIVFRLALGPRPPRLAHRVLGDGRGGVRAGVRDPRRRRSISSSRTTRTSLHSRARSATSSPASGRTTGCSSSAARRCRSRSATTSRSGTCSRRGGGRSCCSSS